MGQTQIFAGKRFLYTCRIARTAIPVLATFLISLWLIAPSHAGPAMAISGTPVVDELGQFNYTIPIATPPGTAGMVPHLALTYSSKNLDGFEGYGWTLSGMDKITRCPQTETGNGISGGVNYDSNDAFCFNGQLLVPADPAVYGASGLYDTQAASMYKVAPHGTQGAGPLWFEVHLKNGTVLELGNTPDSRIESNGGTTTVREWLVNKITDVYGNYLTVQYTDDQTNRQAYPIEIDYTGHQGGAGAYNSVKFNYASRLDVTPFAEAGFIQNITLLLTDIVTYNGMPSTGTPVLDYHLDYRAGTTQSGQVPLHSRLKTLTLCDGAHTNCLAPMNFTWQAGTGFSAMTNTTPSQAPSFFGDFDGDGLLDLGVAACPSASQEIFTGTNTPGSFVSSSMTATYSYYGPGPSYTHSSRSNAPVSVACDFDQVIPVDVDRDGFTDVLTKDAFGGGATQFETSVLWNQGGLPILPSFSFMQYATQSGFPSFGAVPVIADFDNDGRPDVIVQSADPNNGAYYWGQGTAGFAASGTIAATGSNYLLVPGDFNGDGCAEVFSQGSSSIRRPTTGGNCLMSSAPVSVTSCTSGTPYAGDFNGDGKTDILVVGGSSATLCLSDGESLTSALPISSSTTWHSYQIVVGDWNGDGKADVALIGTGISQIVYLSTGTDFTQVQTISTSSGITAVAKDANNDGADDLWFQKPGTNVFYSSAFQPELLTGIDNGVGLSVTASYDRLNKNAIGSFYTKGATSASGRTNIDGPFYAVSQLAFANGSGAGYTRYNLTYTYTGALGDLSLAPTGAPKSNVMSTGLEMFTQINAIDSRNGFVTASIYFNLPSLFGYLQSSTTRTSGGGMLSSAIYTYEGGFIPDAAKTIRVHITTVNHRDLNGGLFGGPEITTNNHDADYGNVLTSIFTKGSLTRTTDYNTPTNYVSAWILDQVTKTDVTSVLNSSTISRETTFVHDPATGFVTRSDREAPTDTVFHLETVYDPDAFGNTDSIEQVGADILTRTNHVDYTSTNLGQFPQTNTNALGDVSTATFDIRFGTVTSATDPNSVTTHTSYDPLGRVSSIVKPDGTAIVYAYDYCGGAVTCPTTATTVAKATPVHSIASGTQNGAITWTYYDAFDRVVAADTQGLDGDTIRTSSVYDSNGQLYQTSRPYFLVGGTPQMTTFVRDAMFRVTQATFPDLTQASYCYYGEVTSTTNARGQTKKVVLDDQGMVASVTDGQTGTVNAHCSASGGITTAYTYDANGNVLTVTDNAGNQVQSNTYDKLGRKTESTDLDMGDWTYGYDQLDQVIRQTDAKAQVTTITYDKLERPLLRSELGGPFYSKWVWDPAGAKGKLQNACSGSPTVCNAPTTNQQKPNYDSLTRIASGDLVIGSTTYTYTTHYDSDGHLDSLTYPSGFKADYVYNPYGYLVKIVDDASSNVLWHAATADAELHLTQQTAGNGVVTTAGYDPQTGRLLNVCAATTGGSCAGDVANLSYSWDSIGNLSSRADTINGYTEAFCYDDQNRLIVAALNGLCNSPLAKTFDYDSIGNLTRKPPTCNTANCFVYGAGAAGPHALTSIVGSYNGVTNPTFAYDANGNLTSGGGRTITYTPFNMAATVADGGVTLELGYYANHARDQMCVPGCSGTPTSTTYYLYDPSTGGMSEKAVTGGTTTWTDYVLSPEGHIVATRIKTGAHVTWRYTVVDNLGSTVSLTDDPASPPASVVERDSYDPWGKRRNANGTDAACGTIVSQTTRGYTGHEMLDSQCLINMNARLYDPTLGRFQSADSIVPDASDSQSYNRYSYVENNPLNAIDPSGHTDCDETGTHCKHTNDGSDYGIECYGCSGAGWSDGGFVSQTAGNTGNSDWTVTVTINGQLVKSFTGRAHDSTIKSALAKLWSDAIFSAGANTTPPRFASTGGYGTYAGRIDGIDTVIVSGTRNANGGWFERINTALGGAGVGASVVQYGSGAATLGSNLRAYSNGWRGNQYVSTRKISNLAEKTGTGLVALSVGLDTMAWYQGDLSTQHLAANLAMDLTGVFGGPVGAGYAAGYYGFETFYPGGAAGALSDYGNNIRQNQAINPSYLPMDPGKISFHPKKRASDGIPNHKKPQKRDDVIDPYHLPMEPGKI